MESTLAPHPRTDARLTCALGGIRLDHLSMSEAVAEIVCMAHQMDRPRLVCTANLDHLATVTRDATFSEVYQHADLVLADGMPLVWLSKLTGCPLRERVAGSDLFWELGRASGEADLRLFFLGGQIDAADKAACAVRERYPSACIAGTYCPPFGTLDDPDEIERIHAAITMAEPNVLLVAFGSPKQEKWIAAHQSELGVPVAIGVGASFDMAAGMVRRAPLWMQRQGMEWMFRLAQEPSRLAHRYLGKDLPFLFSLTLGMVRDRVTGAYKRSRS